MKKVGPCTICLTEQISDPASLESCSHVYCYLCIVGWAKRTNTCPSCKARFLKVTRTKDGRVTEVEERQQGTNYSMEDAENEYGDSDESEESAYGAAHPFLDEEAESGDESSYDEVEAQKESDRWCGYLNCENERFEKHSSEEEREALSDEDYANESENSYEFGDFVVPDDDVSMLTDASSDSSERGRAKRRRLKRTRRSASSSSEIRISIEEEESLDEDLPRRKRRRIDDDTSVDGEQQSAPVSSHQIAEPLTSNNSDTSARSIEVATVVSEEASVLKVVAVDAVPQNAEKRMKKRKRVKKNKNKTATCGAIEISSSAASQSTPVTDPRPSVAPTNAATAPGAEQKKKRKKKKKKQLVNGAQNAVTESSNREPEPLPAPIGPPTSNGSSPPGAVDDAQKKRKKKKKKQLVTGAPTQSAVTKPKANHKSEPLPTPAVPQTSSESGTLAAAGAQKKRKKKKKKQLVTGAPTQSSVTEPQASHKPEPLPAPIGPQTSNGGSPPGAVDGAQKKKKKKRHSNQAPRPENSAQSIPAPVSQTSGVTAPQVITADKSTAQQAPPAGDTLKKKIKKIKKHPITQQPPAVVEGRKELIAGNGRKKIEASNGEPRNTHKTKKQKSARNANRPSTELSVEERSSVESMERRLRRLIGL